METMELLLLLFILCVLVTAADGNSQVIVKEDSDAVLPCSPSSKENLEGQLIDWKKDLEKGEERRVFMYDGGRYSGKDFDDQDKEFEGRVTHFPHELKNANASIKIRNTKVSDSGTYTCIFPHPEPSQPDQTFSVQLVVVCILKVRREDCSGTCPKPSTKQIKITNDQALLQCVVQAASPKPEVEWRDSSGNILQADDIKVTESRGRYDIILNTTVTKSDTYSCVVTQREFCHEVHDDILVYLSDPAAQSSGSPVERIVAVVLAVVVLVLVVLGVLGYRKNQSLQRENQSLQRENQSFKETLGQDGVL